jgi:transposase
MELKKIASEIRQILEDKRKELELTFVEDTHTYYMKDLDGEIKTNFPSVSKVLKKFYEEFDAEGIALSKARGNVREKNKLLAEWKAAGDYSTNMGSRVHYMLEKKLIEDYGNYKEVRQPIFNCDFGQILKGDSMINAGTKYLKLMNERNTVLLDTEIVLGHPEIGYTGQPDKVWLVENKQKTGFGLLITDWKTNKPKNFMPNQFTKKMKHPFDEIDDTALGHYYLQLPFYGKLLLKMLEGTKYENLKLYGCIVTLLREDSEFEEFRVPQKVIDTILEMDMKNYLS